jgi:hypothetical protein
MLNPLGLKDAELDALRGLHLGMSQFERDDPIWEGLEQFGCVESYPAEARIWMLTPLGRRYPTG